ncbi:MAG: 3-hydroxyacyl-CoA dehydrogenase [Rhodothermales bacterium]|nr:3-hydroxyacyl-CoA dehydrogenase [Rhodothermales bacterium]MBO6780950.1 3-hydroxyacyl-CoA dehydrogenase [Rhodothermales bacterium]
MDLKGSAFIVTGGGSGLGAGTAARFREYGANVVVADINQEAGEEHARRIGARFVHTDVTSEESTQAAVQACRETFGKVSGVVNCAGILVGRRTLGRKGPHDLESFARIVQVNLVGTFNVIRLAAAAMADNEPGEDGERGVIINTASIAAYDGQIGQAAYSASKGGVVGMTLPIARDLSGLGIRVVTIAPGVMLTPMVSGMPAEVQESLAAQIPFPSRLGTPEDYAFLAQHIVENRMLNGEVIRLDGAIRMGPK